VGTAAFEVPPGYLPNDDMEFAAVPHRTQFGSIVVTLQSQVIPSAEGNNGPLGGVGFQATT
jgi:hypothetical protein